MLKAKGHTHGIAAFSQVGGKAKQGLKSFLITSKKAVIRADERSQRKHTDILCSKFSNPAKKPHKRGKGFH